MRYILSHFQKTQARSSTTYLLKILVICFFYIILGKSGLSLGPVNKFATLVWPPTGVAFTALFLFGGYKLWPAVALGAFIVNFSTGASIPVTLGISLGNTLEAVLAVYFAKRFILNPKLEKLRDVFILIIPVALISTLASATIGTTSLFLGGTITSSSFFSTWLAWWVGDILGDIVFAPVLLTWLTSQKITFSTRNAFVFIFISLLTILSTLLVFTGIFGLNNQMLPIEYIILAPLIWMSLRFGQKSSVSLFFLVSAIAVWGTTTGYGPFARPNLSQSLLLLQGFLGINASTFLILSAIVSEFKDLEARKDAFVALASHELKTPVTALRLFIYSLTQRLKKKKDKKIDEILVRINRQIDRQTELVHNLLDVSQIQRGNLQYSMEVFDLDELITEIVENVHAISKTSRLIFKEKCNKTVYADRDRIGQVIINLLTNAIKYSSREDRIIIRAKSNKRHVTVSVQDFGKGIAPQDRKKIFEKFYQSETKSQQTKLGLGLGLFISLEIIKRHHGKIWIKSKLNRGSTFFFTLPL